MTIVFVLYLYIFISKNQSKVPEVRFWGQSIPISGSSVRPRVITPHFRKCVNADLVLLQLQGIRIMNYIDVWLILAQSHQLAVRHRYVVLAHMKQLGLWLNAKECAFSTLSPMVWDSTSMQVQLSPAHIESILSVPPWYFEAEVLQAFCPPFRMRTRKGTICFAQCRH